ncbi:MAG: DUF2807 domain-containing protein [Chthoniobacter sp.]|uniref:GIN domain-containing protein n=1 Tax=Chthoniobacter sp. TaxID=2510640 RepID=UPI0032ACF4CF
MKLSSAVRHLATAAVLGGCSVRTHTIKGDGNITPENRSIAEFTSIKASGALDIRWASGPPALTITTDQNLLPEIHTEVSGKTLEISYNGSLEPTKGIKITVASGTIDKANITGAVHLGVSKFTGDSLSVEATGASAADIDGSVGDLTANLTGASQLKASGLQAKTAKVTLVGASTGDVAVDEALTANLTGACSLTYAGEVKSVKKNIAGASSIRRR